MDSVDTSSPVLSTAAPPAAHCILFRNHQGSRVRRFAQFGVVTGIVSLAVIAGSVAKNPDMTAPSWALAATLIAFAVWFGVASYLHARRFVVHFEIWPQSHLVMIRTAGGWRERIILESWNQFSGGARTTSTDQTAPSMLMVRLRSGRVLIFEPLRAEVSHGWVALHRFLDRCSLPESSTDGDSGAVATVGA